MLQPIILAAGKGTRMKTELPKPLFEVNGKAMIRWVLDAIAGTPHYVPPMIVVGYGASHIKKTCGDAYTYVEQEEVNGTAKAVEVCLPHVHDDIEGILVLYGDHPFIRSKSLQRIGETFLQKQPTIAMFTVEVPDFQDWRATFTSFGRVIRDRADNVARVVEYKNASPEERVIREVNPGVYCVDLTWLRGALPKIKPDPVKGEYYLTDVIEIAKLDGKAVMTVPLAPKEAVGINSREDADLMTRLEVDSEIL